MNLREASQRGPMLNTHRQWIREIEATEHIPDGVLPTVPLTVTILKHLIFVGRHSGAKGKAYSSLLGVVNRPYACVQVLPSTHCIRVTFSAERGVPAGAGCLQRTGCIGNRF